MNSIMIENATPFSPECFILFSPEFIFTDLEVKTKEECLKIMGQAMEEKHVVTEDFMIQLWIVRVKQQQRLEMGSVFRMVHRQRLMNQKLG